MATDNEPPKFPSGQSLPAVSANLPGGSSAHTYRFSAAQLTSFATDADGDALSIADMWIFLGKGSLGTEAGYWYYTPEEGDTTEVIFTLQITDGTDIAQNTVSMDLLEIETNNPPTTEAVTLTAINGVPADVLLEQYRVLAIHELLSEAHDPEKSPLTVTAMTVSSGLGDVRLLDGEVWVYIPEPGDTSEVSFTYTISDGTATVEGTATMDILEPPPDTEPTTALVDLGAIDEDVSRSITPQQLLLMADDLDGDELSVLNLAIDQGNGVVELENDGTWTYTPAPNDHTGVTFTYEITDGDHTIPGSASLDLLSVNDAPVAMPDQAVTRVNTSVVIDVVRNDTDVDGDELTLHSLGPASHGSVEFEWSPNGLVARYFPHLGFSGFDSFEYTVSDGTDRIELDISASRVPVASGFDTTTVQVLVASHTGDTGNNSMFTTAGADFVLGNGGNDYIQAFGGADYVDAGAGRDTVFGGSGADTLLGGEDNDTFYATSFELLGDSINGGEGIDTLVLTGSTNFVLPVFSFSNLEQLSFSSVLSVDQTSGLDLSSLALTGTGRTINGGSADNRIIGTRSNETLSGGGGSDNLNGSLGNDTVQGGTGSDTVNGGAGNDTLAGNTTAAGDGVTDIFVFNTPLNAATNVDQIVRFEATSTDRILLDGSIFMSPLGGDTLGLDGNEFHSAAGALSQAQDGNDFILFDTTTGNLYYDADGIGIGARVLFASLGSTFTGVVDAGDFQVLLPALP